MRKKVLNIFILVVALFLFNSDGVNAESSTLTCKYSSADGKNAATVTFDFNNEKKRRVVITKYNGEKRDDNNENELNKEVYDWVIKTKKCPEALGVYKPNLNFKTYSGSKEEVETWNNNHETIKLIFMKNSSSKTENSVLKCYYDNETAETSVTITYDENDPLRKTFGAANHQHIKITKFLGINKNNDEPDNNTLSFTNAINTGNCPESLALYHDGNSYEMYSGGASEVIKWLAQYESEKKTRLLVNNDSNLVVGYDGETFDEMYNAFTGATLDCSTEECLKLEPSCKSSNETCLNNQKKLLVYGRKLNEICKERYADASIKNTDKEYTDCETFDKKYVEYAKAGYFGSGFVTSSTSGCTETLGSLGEWLTKIYKILLLAVPVIIMIFGFKDFMRAILNGKEDELKKSGSTFIKRLVFGAVFVALPIFIKVILSLALGGSFSDICIL